MSTVYRPQKIKASLDVFGARLKKEHEAAIKVGQPPVFQRLQIQFKGTAEISYAYCRTQRIRNFGKVRLVISHRRADLSDKPIDLISNRLVWQAKGIGRIYRHR